jgi:hypothetical protein
MPERRSYRPTGEEHEAKATSTSPEAEPQKSVSNNPVREQGDSKFVNITGLFPSKSGKADTVFVTEAIEGLLHEIRPGDLLGISENQTSHRIQMWYIRKDKEPEAF